MDIMDMDISELPSGATHNEQRHIVQNVIMCLIDGSGEADHALKNCLNMIVKPEVNIPRIFPK